MTTSSDSFFSRLKSGLSKTRELLFMNVEAIARGIGPVDEKVLSDLEEALVLADAGASLAREYAEALRAKWRRGELENVEALRAALRAMISETLAPCMVPLEVTPPYPFVVLVVGVNGVGKTTTVGKIAHRLKGEGHPVLLAAGDTFRAAAIEQLKIWADRVGAGFVQHKEGSDSSAVAFDAVRAAKSRGAHAVLIDTAGRLHTKAHLMEEMRKVVRIVGREIPGAPHEVLLVLDATTGQNAISQADHFKAATSVTGLFLAKLDGTAKGGIVVAIKDKLDIPVKFVGTGETPDDVARFNADEFVDALFDD